MSDNTLGNYGDPWEGHRWISLTAGIKEMEERIARGESPTPWLDFLSQVNLEVVEELNEDYPLMQYLQPD